MPETNKNTSYIQKLFLGSQNNYADKMLSYPSKKGVSKLSV